MHLSVVGARLRRPHTNGSRQTIPTNHELFESQDGAYAVDWTVIAKIVESNARARKQNEHSTVVTQSQRTANPFSLFLPDLKTVEVHWGKVRDETQIAAAREMMRIYEGAHTSMGRTVSTLRSMLEDTRYQNKLFRERLRRAAAETHGNIEAAVSKYDTAISVSKWTRNTSASTLLVGATVLSGGTAGAAYASLAAGSALKGAAKYQDTGNLGAATLEVTGNLIFGVIPVARGGAALRGAEAWTVVTLEAQWETMTALVEGRSVAESLAAGALKFVEPVVGALVSTNAVQAQLEKWAIPAATKLLTGDTPETIRRFVSGTGEMMGKQAVKKGYERGMAGMGVGAVPASKSLVASGPSRDRVADRATVDFDDWVLTWSIIDMQRGLGN